MMKKLSLFFLLLLLATSCATTGATKKTSTSGIDCPVFYTGKDEPAAFDKYIYSENEQ
jgi:ABC-type glycerol-3-phosphate transport system substrate-binding protein